jgi:hypothetical protein
MAIEKILNTDKDKMKMEEKFAQVNVLFLIQNKIHFSSVRIKLHQVEYRLF